MLVLSRKTGERIHIGDNISVVIVDVHGEKVRLGVEAPREVHVLRDELLAGNEKHETPSENQFRPNQFRF